MSNYIVGDIGFDPALTPAQLAWLEAWLETRHEPLLPGAADNLPDPLREAAGLPCGPFGELYTGAIFDELTAKKHGLLYDRPGHSLGRWVYGTHTDIGFDPCQHPKPHPLVGWGCQRVWQERYVVAPDAICPTLYTDTLSVSEAGFTFDGDHYDTDDIAHLLAWMSSRIFRWWGVTLSGVLRIEWEDEHYPSYVKAEGGKVYRCDVDEEAAKAHALANGKEVTFD